MLISANFASMDETQGDLGTKVEQLTQVIEDMMSKVNSTEWEADDQGAYLELQQMWNKDDNSLQDVLTQIKTQVGNAQDGYVQTIANNVQRFV